MMKIECIIRPNKILDVKNALGSIGINGMTVTEAIGCGLQKGRSNIGDLNSEDWNTALDITLLPKTKIEMVVSDEVVEDVIDVIIEAAWTGEIGDGKIFTYPVSNAVRIRTKERGEKAI